MVENHNKGKSAKVNSLTEITYKSAFLIGMFQLIAAIFPGTSRSGATIVGALMIGVSRSVAAEYTFFLAIPVMFGASLLKLYKFGFHFTATEAERAQVMLVSETAEAYMLATEIWTRKESYAKACGAGLGMDFSRIPVLDKPGFASYRMADGYVISTYSDAGCPVEFPVCVRPQEMVR